MPTLIDTITPADILQPVKWPQDARQDSAGFAPSLTVVKGTLLGKLTTGGKLSPYATANVNGTGTAVAIAMYTFRTDANGKAYIGDTATASHQNVPLNELPIWIAGTFDTTELTGYDADALVDLNGRITHDGYLRIP